jgi:hypothetical protein
MKPLFAGIGIGATATAAIVGGIVGFQAYLQNMITEAIQDTESPDTANQPSPLPIIVTSTPTAPEPAVIEVTATASPTPPTDIVPFESLSYCDQLDAIARARKAVSQFIIDSGQFAEYDWAIKSDCSWHVEQADLAYNTLNPPTVETPISVQQELIYPSDSRHPHHGQWLAAIEAQRKQSIQSAQDLAIFNASFTDSSLPSTGYREPNRVSVDAIDPGFSGAWNNCNGVQEPGESYSRNCHREQMGLPSFGYSR